MGKVRIWKPTDDEIKEAKSWNTWSKEESTFDWYYDEPEQFYVVEGEVEVELDDGTKVKFGAGDMVRFESGVSCTWHVKKKIFKHYKMG
ncbi:MAG: cupin domain-containing protein [Fervidobacterium pennivorans]|uniref:Cupin n=1 Tax=Fervidobacterium pennivorans TaxID=93466 RepID=A0A172T4S7_FERPE|nr:MULTISPECIES: cupin domain-containing protein [Fervidobacterium]ANE41964.1 cupin [Fervidobacterium pennivorans]MDM7321119.1 cupin domain-containing protein [Fervidobacterium sp.]NPU89928.1 cupin domain-containing protein [Fervidobacterium sp.]